MNEDRYVRRNTGFFLPPDKGLEVSGCVGFEGFEGQWLRARLCCRRYLTPYFGYIILPHVDWPAQCLAQRKSQKKYTKRKDRNR